MEVNAIEKNKEILDKARSREIVAEILQFGVSQNQVKMILKLLALELEDRNMMLSIVSIVDNVQQESTKPKLEF